MRFIFIPQNHVGAERNQFFKRGRGRCANSRASAYKSGKKIVTALVPLTFCQLVHND